MNAFEMLRQQTQAIPDSTAVLVDDARLSFQELEQRALRLASALAQRGVRKGSPVIVYAGNGLPWVECFFATAALGAVLVPLPFRWRGRELLRVIQHCQPAAIVFDRSLRSEIASIRPLLPAMNASIQIGNGDMPSWATAYEPLVKSSPPEAPATDIGPDDVHSICYTSGTTGAPKGAVLTHSNVVTGTHDVSRSNLGYTRDDVFLNPGSLAHRAGWARLVQSIGVGATHVLMRRFDPEQALRLIEMHRVTVAGFAATMIRMIDRHEAAESYDLSSVRLVLTIGEACPLPLKRRILALFPAARIVSTFASTETGIVSALQPDAQLERPASVGKPLPGVDVAILGDDHRPFLTGAIGEIAVRQEPRGAPGLMREYHNNPAANAAAFVDGWFLTGDLGYFDDDGYLYIQDRKQGMILTGGLNVSATEVEACLLEHPAVSEAAVVGIPDPTWGEAIAALVLVHHGASVDAGALIEHCKAHLASYKKPRIIKFVTDFPRAASGKIQKHTLKDLFTEVDATPSSQRSRS